MAIGAAGLQTGTTLLSRLAFDGRYDGIDATLEGNIWTWASSGATLVAAAAALACAAATRTHRLRFGALGVTLVYFSLDDWIQVHERIGVRLVEILGVPEYVGGLWIVTYPPLLLVTLWGLLSTARDSLRAVRLTLLAAVGLLVASVAIELAGIPTKALARNGIEWPHDVRSTIEEACELAAWILLAGALFAAFLNNAVGDARSAPRRK